ncbi:type II secretion system major pseudopilin GspG [Ignatzschineria sp. LJL83]
MFKSSFKTLYKQGFSLVELMILSVIVAILMAMFSQNVLGINDESKITKAHQNLRSIEGALGIFRDDLLRYPSSEEGLKVLVEPIDDPRWKGPYIQKEMIIDPWDIPYYYELTPKQYFIITLGQDRKINGKNLNQDIVYQKHLTLYPFSPLSEAENSEQTDHE